MSREPATSPRIGVLNHRSLLLQKARRRRVPAFGEWNYNYHHDAPQAAALPPPAVAAPAACYAVPEPEACSDVWFRYSPPPRKPVPKKQTGRRPEGDVYRERSKASWDAAAAKGGGSRRVVRPVDGDLYQVPPRPELASHRRPRKTRSLWMGCLGLNSCVD